MPRSPPPGIDISAAEFFEKNAKFNVPAYFPPSASKSSSEVLSSKLDKLELQMPKVAFPDPGKCRRLIDSLTDALDDLPLLAGESTGSTAEGTGKSVRTYSEIKAIYAGLFSPRVEYHYGRKKNEWKKICNEVDSNCLTETAMLNALEDVTYRMQDREIEADTEPLKPPIVDNADNNDDANQPRRNPARRSSQDPPRRQSAQTQQLARLVQYARQSSSSTTGNKDKVDFVMKEGDVVLYLVEGKNPQVLDQLDLLLGKNEILTVNLHVNSTNSLKVFNKAIYYMLYWDAPFIVITSFRAAYILELHKIGNATFVSYSSKILQKNSTEMFRALLGLTWITMELAEYEEFDIDGAVANYIRKTGGGGGGPSQKGPGPSGSGPGKKGGPDSGKKPDDGSKKGPSGSGGKGGLTRFLRTRGRGTKRNYDLVEADESNVDGIAVETAPGEMIFLSEAIVGGPHFDQLAIGNVDGIAVETAPEERIFLPEAIVGGPHFDPVAIGRTRPQETMIKHVFSRYLRFVDSDGLHRGSGLAGVIFERASQSPFPFLTTLSQVPCLEILGSISFEDGKAPVYEAQLRLSYTHNRYAVKVITASMAPSDHFRNIFGELAREYSTYYAFALGRRDPRFADVIRHVTPSCFGLYRARDQTNTLRDIFVLVLEYAGSVSLDFWANRPMPEKHAIMQSILCLHSLGCIHGDAEERNLAFQFDEALKETTCKFLDYDNSYWHLCPGIEKCIELRDCWYRIFEDDTPLEPREFQLKTSHLYGLQFVNLKAKFKQSKKAEEEYTMKRLLKLAALYEALNLV